MRDVSPIVGRTREIVSVQRAATMSPPAVTPATAALKGVANLSPRIRLPVMHQVCSGHDLVADGGSDGWRGADLPDRFGDVGHEELRSMRAASIENSLS